MTTSHLTAVAPTDWTMLRAIARRVLCVGGPQPFRHPSCDQYWEVERSAIRLSGYVASGEMTIDIDVTGDIDDPDVPDADTPGVVVRLSFDDGLEPIVVPWHELELVMEPAPKLH